VRVALESGMTHISGSDRSQLLLLPEAVDDYVAADNPVRFIDAFVEALDLKAAGFARVEAKATGRPGYAPGDRRRHTSAAATGISRIVIGRDCVDLRGPGRVRQASRPLRNLVGILQRAHAP
jgi:hypothetical protein